MGSLSDYAELELLDHVFNAAYSPVATVYLALCTADPTDAGTGASMNECASSQRLHPQVDCVRGGTQPGGHAIRDSDL